MSSILIKDIGTPHCCVVCPFKEMYPDGLLCKATNPHNYIPNLFHKRHEKCPLVEVSTPHGRLIEENDVLREIHGFKGYLDEDMIGRIEFAIKNRTKTIIEAEDGNNDES